MKEMPQIKVGENGLEGWDEFDRWATSHLSFWYHAMQTARVCDMEEIDRLRLVAWMLATEIEKLKDHQIKLWSERRR